MKKLALKHKASLLTIAVVSTLFLGGYITGGHDMKPVVLYSNQELTGGTFFPDTTDWVLIEKDQYFCLFVEHTTDSTYYSQALGGDSLGYDIDYELAGGSARPSLKGVKGADGHWKKGQTAALELMSFVTADTVNGGRWYQSMHDGTADISPSNWIRFILTADANIKTLSTDLELTATLIRQP